MQQMIEPLAITPLQKPHESLMGLILRTAEANGYSSPSIILRYAGLTENEIRSINPPLDKISQLFARKPEEFHQYQKVDDMSFFRKKKWRLTNHVIPTLYVNVKSAKICTKCIEENGCLDEFWDIRFSKICIKHKKELLDACPKCQKHLKWQRLGLLRCACGYDLTGVEGDEVKDQSILNMTALLKWKLHNHQYECATLKAAGYPLDKLEKVSLSTLLGIIERFEVGRKRKTVIQVPVHVKPELSSIWITSNMLADWPKGFFKFLTSLPKEVRRVHSRSVQSHYLRIYKSFFKSGLPENEMLLLKEAFVLFANEDEGANVYIDKRLAEHVDTNTRFVGISGLANYLNVELPTIRNYVKKKLIQPIDKVYFGKKRMMFDTTKVPFLPKEGNYLRQRDAAKFIQISERNLRALKENNVYKFKRLGWGIEGYSELDLKDFRDDLLSKANNVVDNISDQEISLKNVLSKKRLSASNIVSVFKNIQNEIIIPKGRIGDEIADIILAKKDIYNLIFK